jgi:PAS domain S-box-containing protein
VAILDDFSQALPSVIANLPHAVLVVGQGGEVYFCNHSAATVFGYELKELESMSLEMLIPGRHQPMEQLRAVFASGKSPPVNDERIDGLHKDGTEFPAEVSITRLQMEGKQTLAMVLVNDFAGRIPDQASIDRFLETAAASSETIAALDQIESQVVVLDREWLCVFVNQSTLKNLNKTRSELIGKRYWELYPGVVGTSVDLAVRSAFVHRQKTSLEYYYAKYRRWYKIDIIPSRSSLTVHATDITIARRSKLIGDKLLGTLDLLADPIMIINKDWTCTFANQAACRYTGRDRSDLEGRSVWEAFPRTAGTSFEVAYRTAMDSDVPTRWVDYYPPVDRWFDNRFFPTAEGIIVHTLDVTEYKRSSQRLSDTMAGGNTEQELQQAFSLMPNPVILLDRESRFVYINDAGLRPNRRTIDEVVGKNLYIVNPALKGSALHTHIDRALSSGQRQQLDFRLPPIDSWFQIEIIPWRDRLIVYCVDISKQKHGEESVDILTKTLEKILDGDEPGGAQQP